MKKITALLLMILFVFGLAGCAKQTVQFDIKVANKITIFSGSTGQKIEVTDKSAVDHITANFNSVAFRKDKSSKGYEGYAYQITWYDADGKQIELVTVMRATRISYDGYFYDAMEADYEIDMDFIEELMESELPYDDFCFTIDPSAAVEINAEDRDYIINLLNEAQWTNGLTNCGSDFVFYTQKQEVRYHSECGTFNDITNQRAMTVSEEQRIKINGIVVKIN